MEVTNVLGIDIGGSGIKGAIVNTETGALITEKLKLDTPKPATPEGITRVFTEMVKMLSWNGPIGVGFPAIMKTGTALSAANIDPSCIGVNFESLFSDKVGMPVFALNDADAAGIAEVHFGDERARKGLVILITIGSGLGSAIINDGHLVPNTELGHFYLKGMDIVAEQYASSGIKDRDMLSYEEWGLRFKQYLSHLNRLFSPDRIILGGGISKRFDRFEEIIRIPGVEIVPAMFLNDAGTIGAAYYGKLQYLKIQKQDYL